MIIPKHLFADFTGAKSRDAPTNLKPVGTGPYKFVDFKPGDMVRGEINTNYHVSNRPYFDTIEMKGGGDAVSAARAVIQTGEFDYAWNVQVEDEILKKLEVGGKGRAAITPGGNIEFIQLNQADPWTEVDGERANPKSRHPIFSDPAVRQAMALLVDRKGVQDFIYGRTGVATGNFINNPPPFRSPNTKWEFNVDKANAVLEAAGWKKGADGIREKGGKKLKLVFQTSINAPRQKTQAIIKQACQKAGVDLELKSVTASVFFSSDVANPDTYTKFWCDMQMYTTTMTQPDPELFMDQYVSWLMSSRENKWQGRNAVRWKNDEYDKAYRAAEAELDPVKRAALFIKMNEMVILRGRRRAAARRRQDLPAARARPGAGRAVLGGHRVRRRDGSFHPRSAARGAQLLRPGAAKEPQRVGRPVLRSHGASRQGIELGVHRARQAVVHHLPPLRPAAGAVQPGVGAGGLRGGAVSSAWRPKRRS
jgi:peptide/nickel transport system substrate-binding protein